MSKEVRLNLGCSDDHRKGFTNVDSHPPADFIADLSQSWSYMAGESSVYEIYAKDVFEHIDNEKFRGNRGKIWVLNEAYRVLKPDGILEFLVPAVSLTDGRVNPGAFADPTHVSFWTYDDRYYFCEQWNNQQGERGRLGPAYGIKAVFREVLWRIEEYGSGYERRSKLHAILQAIK